MLSERLTSCETLVISLVAEDTVMGSNSFIVIEKVLVAQTLDRVVSQAWSTFMVQGALFNGLVNEEISKVTLVIVEFTGKTQLYAPDTTKLAFEAAPFKYNA